MDVAPNKEVEKSC